MPTIDFFEGIKINIYSIDHVPPHIHAVYSEFEALLVIKTREIYAGSLPVKQLRKAIEWLKENEDAALYTFYALNPGLKK
ncbi:DUF4160 domain-containing protein [Flavitalea sp.]|nr:DUF4160 domain-containing protein [Flavitalea sp.]